MNPRDYDDNGEGWIAEAWVDSSKGPQGTNACLGGHEWRAWPMNMRHRRYFMAPDLWVRQCRRCWVCEKISFEEWKDLKPWQVAA